MVSGSELAAALGLLWVVVMVLGITMHNFPWEGVVRLV